MMREKESFWLPVASVLCRTHPWIHDRWWCAGWRKHGRKRKSMQIVCSNFHGEDQNRQQAAVRSDQATDHLSGPRKSAKFSRAPAGCHRAQRCNTLSWKRFAHFSPVGRSVSSAKVWRCWYFCISFIIEAWWSMWFMFGCSKLLFLALGFATNTYPTLSHLIHPNPSVSKSAVWKNPGAGPATGDGLDRSGQRQQPRVDGDGFPGSWQRPHQRCFAWHRRKMAKGWYIYIYMLMLVVIIYDNLIYSSYYSDV